MDEEISQFISITGVHPERARFYVEAAQGNVETAVSTFFESEEGADATPTQIRGDVEDLTEMRNPGPTGGPRTLSGAPAPAVSPGQWHSQMSSRSTHAQRSGGITSLRDLRNATEAPQPSDDDNDDDDDDEDDDDGKDSRSRDPAHFYTGGERSGLSVENPNRRSNQPSIVQDILKKAAEAGQRAPGEDWGTGAGAAGARGTGVGQVSSPSFRGAGRTIDDSGPSNAGASGSLRPDVHEEGPLGDLTSLETAVRHIIFWQDGFTIEDGPLCRYDDPRHAETLAALNNNRAPLHLLNVAFGQPVELRVEKRTDEKYKYTPPPLKAFSGSGNRLGSATPALEGTASSVASSSTAATEVSSKAQHSTPVQFELDSSKPTTQVQIRLGDGQRLIGRFNHDHTIADMRRYINASHPGMAAHNYTLQASFPPKPLEDEKLTLKDAGLINAVVIQKWT